MAEGRSRKRQWPITTLVAATHRYLQSVGRGNPRHRPHCQSHAEEMPRFQDAVPGDPQRTWQRRANPVLIDPLHLAPESTPPHLGALVQNSWNFCKLYLLTTRN